MSCLGTLSDKEHLKARQGITEKDMTRITARLPLIGDAVKAVSSSSYLTMGQSR